MAGKVKDRVGQRFGKLVVIRATGKYKRGSAVWFCQCDCGGFCEASASSLQVGYTKSCGCLRGAKDKIFIVDDSVGIYLMFRGGYFWFDLEDLPIVEQHNWMETSSGYARSCIDGSWVRFTRLILGLPYKDRTIFVDHINGDTRDNRRCNLRMCSPADNVRHFSKRVAGGKLRGSRYQAKIKVDGKVKYLGMYDTVDEMHTAWYSASVKHRGEFLPYEKIVWFPGCDNDSIFSPKNMLNWAQFLSHAVGE